MRRLLAFLVLSILGVVPSYAQAPNLPALAKINTAALVVQATTSISCGDGSEGTCVRQDSDIVTKVTTIISGTDLWVHFDKVDATKADAILEFVVKDAATTYGRISFSVRDADNNNILYFESRDVVVLENDVTAACSCLPRKLDQIDRRACGLQGLKPGDLSPVYVGAEAPTP